MTGNGAARRLIVCCDGTWNTPDRQGHTTNVVRLSRAIKPRSAEGIAQIAYYHPGVGTGNFLDHWIGGGTGIGLSQAVRSAYAFFVDNYEPGDELFLFGFSRGAYTVRSVAGLIAHVGMLRKHHMENFDAVWDYYRLPVGERDRQEAAFLANFPDRVPRESLTIRCLGVWDTVGALGIPNTGLCSRSYRFHDTNLGPAVEHAYQALAIDERRKSFTPAIWHPSDQPRVAQIVEQVWFPGVHSNIGGGYRDHGLSDVPLYWMAAKVAPLLELDRAYLCAAADRREPYAMGRLVPSLSLFWRLLSLLIGSGRRSIGTADPATEWIHGSAWLRSAASAHPVPAPYRDAAFRDFLAAHRGREMALSPYEQALLQEIPEVPPEPVLPRRFAPHALCEAIIRWLGGGAN